MPIQELWCYVQSDINGREAICVSKVAGQLVPMLGTSLLAMQGFASAVARLDRSGHPPRLKRFTLNTSREDLYDAAHNEAIALKQQLPSDRPRMSDADAAAFLEGKTERSKNEVTTFH
jgi:hypothetical protein